jgi:hypothetical protein
MLARTLPGPHPPWDALYWPTTIHLALFVHRVEDIAPGIYLLVRDPASKELLKEVMREGFVWQTPPGVPSGFPLYLLVETDCRRAARTLSCHQNIAADGFFSVGMIAEFDGPIVALESDLGSHLPVDAVCADHRRGMREFRKDDETDRQKRRAAFDRGIDHLKHAVGVRAHLPPLDRIWQIGLTGGGRVTNGHA